MKKRALDQFQSLQYNVNAINVTKGLTLKIKILISCKNNSNYSIISNFTIITINLKKKRNDLKLSKLNHSF